MNNPLVRIIGPRLPMAVIAGACFLLAACGQSTGGVAAIDHPSGKGLSQHGRPCPPVVSIFLKVGIPTGQQVVMRSSLEHDADVTHLTFIDEATSLAEFGALYANDPNILNAVRPGDLPTSFRFIERDPSKESALFDRYRSRPGVKDWVGPAGSVQLHGNAYFDTSDLIRKQGVPGAPCR
jgi:hypothetical protein